jgi:hypothetical protein
MRVPIVVWSAGPDPRRFSSEDPPRSTADLYGYLLGMVDGRAYTEATDPFLRTPVGYDTQLGVIDGTAKLIWHRALGFAELYHLDVDPFERRDLAFERPEEVARLQREVRSYLDELRTERRVSGR